MTVKDQVIDIGLKLHTRIWAGNRSPFVLVHGLSSNCRTWDAVAGRLAQAGHYVISFDQRGHGLSDKPDNGYDFATVSADLARLLQTLKLKRPVILGQSWGGNVVLEFGARYPGLAWGLGFIDGGFIDFRLIPDATWEKVSAERTPPNLLGLSREKIKRRLEEIHPDWSEQGVEGTLANFETLPDGTVRPWLTLERHMQILRAMWEQRPGELYPQVIEPVFICVARHGKDPAWTTIKARQVEAAQVGLSQSIVHWFDHTDHDIHVQRPDALTDLLLKTLNEGFWTV